MKKLPKIDLKSLRMPAGMQGVADVLAQGSKKVSALGAVAGAGIDVVSATRDERGYLSDLAKEYRPEIAERLGLAENQVTEEHYNMAFADNPVLAQAKEVTKMSGAVRGVNSTIAAAVGLLAGMGASALTRRAQAGGKQADAANIAGGVAATLGAAAAGRVARKFLHSRKLDGALESTAHYKIMEIKGKQQRGEETSAADIFGVQLALNPEVGAVIEQGTGKRFQDMDAPQQLQLMQQEFPEILEVNNEMARLINEKGMRPQELVFGEIRAPKEPSPAIVPLAPGHPDLPPNAQGKEAAIEASGAAAAGKALLEEMRQHEAEHGKPAITPVTPLEETPPITPRSETPLEQEPLEGIRTPLPKQAESKASDNAQMAKEFERALLSMQEGNATQEPSKTAQPSHVERVKVEAKAPTQDTGFAGRLDAERSQTQDAAPQR